MRIFGSERMDGMLQKLGLKEDEAIIHPWINKALEKAQKKVEARNFDIRKNLLKYDDVQNDQRKVVFEQRIDLMDGENLSETVAEMRQDVIDDLVAKHIPENAYAEQWDAAGLKEGCAPVPQSRPADRGVGQGRRHRRGGHPRAPDQAADEAAADRAERFGPEVMTYVERSVMLQTLDHLWREHLVNLDHLRSVVGFRGYAQRDPLNEYKGEGFELFQAHARQSAPGRDGAADARRAGARGRRSAAARSAADVRPPYRRHHRRGRFRRERLRRRRLMTRVAVERVVAPEDRDPQTPRPGARSAATRPAPAAPARSTSTATARLREPGRTRTSPNYRPQQCGGVLVRQGIQRYARHTLIVPSACVRLRSHKTGVLSGNGFGNGHACPASSVMRSRRWR